jgi:predicted DNA-binding transcriptional regulator YafY
MNTPDFYQPSLPFDDLEIERSFNTHAERGDSGTDLRSSIEFSYWIDGSIARSALGHRWLMQAIEREEVYLDEQGQQRRRVLVRAETSSERQILQQIHRYGTMAELISPPELREKMRREVELLYDRYQR